MATRIKNTLSFYNKSILGFLFILIFSSTAFSQLSDTARQVKHYHVNYFTGSLIVAGGLATDYPAIGRIKRKPNITSDELAALNTSAINPIDRWALHQNADQHLMYSKLSDVVEAPAFILLPAFNLNSKLPLFGLG